MKELELYIHIPFCIRKCDYCDFLSFPEKEEQMKRYMEALLHEIETAESAPDTYVTSIFIGGGTPSILPPEDISDILSVCRTNYAFSDNAEITIESNPGTIQKEKLKVYRQAGINRLSIGLQSANNDELAKLGRIHTWEDFLEGFASARACGFTNINIDLMSALPGQSRQSWKETLHRVLKLKPEHISAYSLIIEEGTPFQKKYAAETKNPNLPSEETERQMYYDTKKILKAAGYHRYEISNYAKPGYECRHNTGYWQRKEYRGFGLGAASLINETRFNATKEMNEYLNGNYNLDEPEKLSQTAQMEETMFLGLRMSNGISVKEFEQKFQTPFYSIYGTVTKKLLKEGLLEESAGRLTLTEKGVDLSNYVFTEFLLD